MVIYKGRFDRKATQIINGKEWVTALIFVWYDDHNIRREHIVEKRYWNTMFNYNAQQGICTYKERPDVRLGINDVVEIHIDDNKVRDIRFISRGKADVPPSFYDIGREKVSTVQDHELLIGNSKFVVPPSAIDVSTQSTILRNRSIRSKGSIKSSTGHSNVRVEIKIYFPDERAINDENDGLRALIAQFKRTPFLPVCNKYLNEVHNIHALTLANLIVTNVPDFPYTLEARLICYKFNHIPYIPCVNTLYQALNFDLFTWYYKRNQIYIYDDNGMPARDPNGGFRHGSLKPINTNVDAPFRIMYIPTSELVNVANVIFNNGGLTPENEISYEDLAYANDYRYDMETLLKIRDLLVTIENDGLDKNSEGYKYTCSYYKSIGDFAAYISRINDKLIPDLGLEGVEYYGHTAMTFPFELTVPNDGFGTRGHVIVMTCKGKKSVQDVPGKDPATSVKKDQVSFIVESPEEIPMVSTIEQMNNLRVKSPRTRQLIYNVYRYALGTSYVRTPPRISEQDFAQKMQEWPIRNRDKISITNIMCAYENLVSDLQIAGMDSPTHQYLGSQDIFVKVDMIVSDDEALEDLHNLAAYCQSISREFPRFIAGGFIKIEQPLANLFGVEHVLIDQFHVRTIDGYPNVYEVSMVMIDFNTTQKRLERTGGIIGTADTSNRFVQLDSVMDGTRASEELKANIHSVTDSEGKKIGRWISINDLFKYFEVYPDLDLPKWSELAAAGLAHHIYLFKVDDTEIKTVQWSDTEDYINNTPNGGIFVDPDFYFYPGIPNSSYIEKWQNGKAASITYMDELGDRLNVKYGDLIDELAARRVEIEEELPESIYNNTQSEATSPSTTAEADNIQLEKEEDLQRVKSILKSNNITAQEDRIEACTNKDWKIRINAWPAIPELITAHSNPGIRYASTNEDQAYFYQQDANKHIRAATLKWPLPPNASNIVGSLFLYESRLFQLFTYSSVHPKTGDPIAIGQPHQKYDQSRDEWVPQFGIAMINIKENIGKRDHRGDTFDPALAVYDYQYNIEYGIKLLREKYDEFYSMIIFNMDMLDGIYEGYKPGMTLYSMDVRRDLMYVQTAVLKLAAVAYGTNFTLEQVCNDIRTKNRASKAYIRWRDMFAGDEYVVPTLEQWSTWEPETQESFEQQITNNIRYRSATMSDTLFSDLNQFEPPIMVKPEPYHQWHDYKTTDATNRMLRAFPTYHLILIDEGRHIRWWKLWDNFYGMSAVSEIIVHRSRKNIADTCTISLSNVYHGIGDVSTRGADEEYIEPPMSFFEIINPFKSFTDEHLIRRDKLEKRLALAPGSRISLRIGYGSNASKLPIIFNGTIAELAIGDMVEIIAQGDGIELTNKLPFGDESIGGFLGFGAEPRNLIIGLMTNYSWFKKIINTVSRGRLLSENTGVVHFGSIDFSKGTPFTYNAGEIGENIYSANYKQNFEDAAIINPFTWFKASNDEKNITVDVYNKTTWDIIQTCALAMPNYIAAVMPVGFRSTLFYGMPHWNAIYDWEASDQTSSQPVVQNKLSKPYQQWHIYTSLDNILDNSIKATAMGMYTNVIGSYQASVSSILGSLLGKVTDLVFATNTSGDHEATVTAYADQDIYPQFQRTTYIDTGIRVDSRGLLTYIVNAIPGVGTIRVEQQKAVAFAVAQSAVRDYLRDMYDGELVVIGDPSVKPYDSMYIWDKHNDMFGVCEVKEVIQRISTDTGFVTSIKPDLCVMVADPFRHALLSWQAAVAAGATIESILTKLGTSTLAASKNAVEVAASATKEGVQKSAQEGFLKKTGDLIKGEAAKVGEKMSQESLDTLANTASWAKDVTGALGEYFSAVSTAVAASKAFAVGSSIPFVLGAAVLAIGIKSIANWVSYKADQAECVVCNFLVYHGREFSAGILGHKGIVIGQQTQWLQFDWMNKALDFIGLLAGGTSQFSKHTVDWHDSLYGNLSAQDKKIIQLANAAYMHKDYTDRDVAEIMDSFTSEQLGTRVNVNKLAPVTSNKIQFSNDLDERYHMLMPALADTLSEIINSTNHRITISTTWNPDSGVSIHSYHPDGMAVSVSHVDGKRIVEADEELLNSFTPEGYPRIEDYVNEAIANNPDAYDLWVKLVKLAKLGQLDELYSPFGAIQRDSNGNCVDLFEQLMLAGDKGSFRYQAIANKLKEAIMSHQNTIEIVKVE